MNTRPAELYHHGILGMHWGVRRYQNEDGSLTPAGKARFNKVASSERLRKRNTKQAIKILSTNKKSFMLRSKALENMALVTGKISLRNMSRAENAKDNGNVEKHDKLLKISTRLDKGSSYFTERAHRNMLMSEIADKKIKSISSEELKAGIDFIVKTYYRTYNTGQAMVTERIRTLIEKQK